MVKVFLVEDEAIIRRGIRDHIDWNANGFEFVGEAGDGEYAYPLIMKTKPDILVTDIKMPFMDGLELAKQIQENYINTKVILFSGWDDFEYARLAISYGVSEYIMKPIDYNEMQKLLMEMHEELDQEYNEKINRVRLEEAYTKSLPLLRQQFFSQLVTEPMEEAERELQIKNLKLDFFDLAYSIVAVKIQKEEEKDFLNEWSMKETLKEALENIAHVYEFGMGEKEIFLLGGEKKHEIGKITRSIQEAEVMIERLFGARISCGISGCSENLSEMPLLYAQALEALDYNLVLLDENYTYYNDIMPHQEVEEDWSIQVEMIGKKIPYMTEAELKVQELLRWLHKGHYTLNEYQIVILEISFSVARFYKKYQITSDTEFAGTKKMAVKILSLSTGEELDHWLLNYFLLIRSLIQKKQVDNNVVLAENAKKIVEESFQNPELSVESVCNQLHVSTSYFSKVFKQVTGGTFLNYLIGRRMEEAKKLLLQTDYKSHAIGTMVGYPEPNYFSYVFKKNCGISPVKYRKLGAMDEK